MQTCLCPNCKAIVPNVEGPTHPYFGSNAGCWKIYGEILEREYRDPRYMVVHRLTVDAYAAQHPGRNEPRSVQSVNIHLAGLYFVLVKKLPFNYATKYIGKLADAKKHGFEWLVPPSDLGELTVLQVYSAGTVEEHSKKIMDWAECVWQAWQIHHRKIENLASTIL